MPSDPGPGREPLFPALLREGFGVLTIGWDLGIPIVGGVLLGYTLDRWLGTGHIFTLGLLVLGVIGAYYNLSRLIRQLDRRDRERKAAQSDEEREP